MGSSPIVSTGKPQVRGCADRSISFDPCGRSHLERSLLLVGYVERDALMAREPTVRWNETAGRWMAWVRFPDGSRRKVERVDKADAKRDLDELITLRAQSIDPGPRHTKLATFDEVIEVWFRAGCPNVAPTSKSRHARVKSPNTIANARQLLGTSVLPVIGKLWVDRTSTERLEKLFNEMATRGLRDEHDRPQLELPEPGMPARAAGATDPHEPSGRRACCRRSARRSSARASRSNRPSACWSTRSRPTVVRRCG